MIHLACPSGGRNLRVKDELAGKRGVCPYCRQRMAVPASSRTQLFDAGTLSPAADLDGEALDFLAPPQGPGEIGRLGTYRIVKVLGVGGMGMVLQAEDLVLKRAVALKVMRSALTKSKDARQRFLREARAIAAIEHRHIVHIYQVGEDRGVAYLAMPFLKGESLETRLKRERKLSVADAVRIGRQIAEGLAAAHKSELIHRDIKPGNI
jgi:serine/threonine protein kinase